MSRPFDKFVGIDLGGGKGKNTALAVLKSSPEGVTVVDLAPRARAAPLYDTALLDLLRAAGDNVLCAIDAPLTLPACLRCEVPVCPGQDPCTDASVISMRRLATISKESNRDARRGKPHVTPYTQRATEVYLDKCRGILPRETLGQGMGPLTARAAHLMRALADRFVLNQNLIEVYPRATLELLGLCDPYKKRIDTRLNMLARLDGLNFAPGVWREECVHSDHLFDAVICAYTAYLWSRDGWQLPAEAAGVPIHDGWIWVPPVVAQSAINQDERLSLP